MKFVAVCINEISTNFPELHEMHAVVITPEFDLGPKKKPRQNLIELVCRRLSGCVLNNYRHSGGFHFHFKKDAVSLY